MKTLIFITDWHGYVWVNPEGQKLEEKQILRNSLSICNMDQESLSSQANQKTPMECELDNCEGSAIQGCSNLAKTTDQERLVSQVIH